MARLIDADALMGKLRRMPKFEKTDFDKTMLYVEKSIIDAMPTVTDNNVGSKWIPVTERLPEKTIDVLLWFGGKYKNMAVGFWHGCEECEAVYWCAYTDDGFYTDCDYKPTHWMPLPEPPKEVE